MKYIGSFLVVHIFNERIDDPAHFCQDIENIDLFSIY